MTQILNINGRQIRKVASEGGRESGVVGGSVVRASPSEPSDSPILCRVSDETIDRYNSIVRLAGWDIRNFEKNSVVPWCHESWQPPIGNAQNTRVEKDGLYSELVFAPRGAYPLADSVQNLVRAGFIHAVSAGWITKKWAFDEERGGVDFIESELLEWSPVTIPGNPNALIEGRAAGIDVEPVLANIEEIARRAGWMDPKAVETLRMGVAPKVFSFAIRVGKASIELAAPSVGELDAMVAKYKDPELGSEEKRDDEPAAEEPEAGDVKCAGCGETIDPSWKFCANCGAARSAMTEADIIEAVNRGFAAA